MRKTRKASLVLEGIANMARWIFTKKFRFSFDRVPYMIENVGFKKVLNTYITGMNALFPKPKPFGWPAYIQIEPTNICNLKCPLCPTGSGESDKKLPKANMPM